MVISSKERYSKEKNTLSSHQNMTTSFFPLTSPVQINNSHFSQFNKFPKGSNQVLPYIFLSSWISCFTQKCVITEVSLQIYYKTSECSTKLFTSHLCHWSLKIQSWLNENGCSCNQYERRDDIFNLNEKFRLRKKAVFRARLFGLFTGINLKNNNNDRVIMTSQTIDSYTGERPQTVIFVRQISNIFCINH